MKLCNDKLGADKKLHVFFTFVIAAFIGAIAANIPPHNPWLTAVIAFVAAMAVGLWKEFLDRKKKGGHFCLWDLAWDTVGALGGAALAWLAAFFINVFI